MNNKYKYAGLIKQLREEDYPLKRKSAEAHKELQSIERTSTFTQFNDQEKCSPNLTQCPRCNNPHNACDGGESAAAPRCVTKQEDQVLRNAALRAGKIIDAGRITSGPASAKPLPEFVPGSSKELNAIHAVVMDIGGDWPEVEDDPYTLYHVKRMARELSAPVIAKPPHTCTWTPDEEVYYSTECGEAYVFNDGTPKQNNAYFCHHCGGKLITQEPTK